MNIDNFVKGAPSRLDDIIRRHREELELSVASEKDLAPLNKPFLISNLKGILRAGFVYKWQYHRIELTELYLVGHRVGAPDSQAIHSSRIVAYDPDNKVVLTETGSHYILEEFIEPESDRWLLLHICHWLHGGYAGKYHGVPEVRIFQ